jgi:HK97 gp10 family phage protein
MGLQVAITGLTQFAAEMKRIDERIDNKVSQAIARTTLRIETTAKRKIQRGPASGEVYELYNPRRTHQASAPEQPPMSDTGRLASSIEHFIGPKEGVVFTRVDYGRFLEYGTSKMQPRPWLFPSLEENRRYFQEQMAEAFQ